MKKYLFMAVAAIAVLSSCSNDDSFNEDQQSGKAVQFTATLENDATTRTTLSGTNNDVNWASGDVISVNGSLFSTESTTNSGTFNLVSGQTAASGSTYTACYPSSMYDGGTISLPASYTYSAGQFNMPMYAQSTTTKLGFKNLCGVLAITVPSTAMTSVSTIVVSSDQQMNGAFTATAEGVLTFTSKTLTSTDKKVTLDFSSAVTIEENSSKTFYLPVPAGSHTLKVEIFAGTTGNYMTTTSAVSIERNKIYSITFKANNESKSIDLALPSGLLWATCNVGASSASDYGNYYAWGATTGHSGNGTNGTQPDGYSFSWANAPYQTESTASSASTTKWSKYCTNSSYGTEDNKKVLEAMDDAATANKGSSWRMPTTDEFLELARNCYIEWSTGYNGTSVNGLIVYKAKDAKDKGLLHTNSAWKEISSSATSYSNSSKTGASATYSVSDTHIFLPAAGYRYNTSLYDAGSRGFYWSSSLNTSNPNNAYYLKFDSSNVLPQNSIVRYRGHGVRPVCQ